MSEVSGYLLDNFSYNLKKKNYSTRKNNLKLSKVFDFYKTKVKKCILAKNRNQAVLLLQKARTKLHIQCCKTVIQYLVFKKFTESIIFFFLQILFALGLSAKLRVLNGKKNQKAIFI